MDRHTIPVHNIGSYFQARNGTFLRIVCNDMRSSPFKIIGLVTLNKGPNLGNERIVRYMPCGKSSEGPNFDLVKPLKLSEYLNLSSELSKKEVD